MSALKTELRKLFDHCHRQVIHSFPRPDEHDFSLKYEQQQWALALILEFLTWTALSIILKTLANYLSKSFQGRGIMCTVEWYRWLFMHELKTNRNTFSYLSKHASFEFYYFKRFYAFLKFLTLWIFSCYSVTRYFVTLSSNTLPPSDIMRLSRNKNMPSINNSSLVSQEQQKSMWKILTGSASTVQTETHSLAETKFNDDSSRAIQGFCDYGGNFTIKINSSLSSTETHKNKLINE